MFTICSCLNVGARYGPHMSTFYEFFAGGGMARAGLGTEWQCLFANDIDPMKAKAYAQNWGDGDMVRCDVAKLSPHDLPGRARLVWASFPCQDLSLAGHGRGLGNGEEANATRSGTFWSFWNLISALRLEGRPPQVIVLENVVGTLTSRDGQDFAAIVTAIANAGYRVGAMVIDARHFVPQSRPRLFFVAVSRSASPGERLNSAPTGLWHPRTLQSAVSALPEAVRPNWAWWAPPTPPPLASTLADLVETEPLGVRWHADGETEALLGSMSPVNKLKLDQARATGRRQVGTVYKRTRTVRGVKSVHAEVRFDGIAGCLRTPSGGSSRQTILLVHGDVVRSRLLSPREAARLMGLPDDFRLPERYNDAYHLAGDGVCVPVVRYLSEHLLEPLLGSSEDAGTRRLAA